MADGSPSFLEKIIDGFPKPIFFNPNGYLSKGGVYYNLEKSIEFVKNLKAFKNWFEKTNEKFGDGFQSVNILEIYPFVNETKPIGFVMIDASVTYNGKPVPGAAFIRGGAVAILTIIQDEDDSSKMYVVNTVQPRIPGSEPNYEEIPAGMIDNSENFAGVAAKEMEEETGIKINKTDLVSIGTIYPSIGGCDEFIALYRVIKKMKSDEIQKLQGKLTGNISENESITLKVRTMEDFINGLKNGEITDAKAMSAYAQHIINPIPSSGGYLKKSKKRKLRNKRKTKR